MNIYEKTNMRENITYSSIKGGIINYTRQMASYYGKKNIRINSISPGGVIGPVQGVSKKQNKNFIRNYRQKVPIGRLAESSEIASVIAFLASPAASYINGANIMVDGGWSII